MSLADEIRRQNLWWRGERAAEDTVERDLESRVWEELDEDIITAITGMRQVGKTTLLFRLIDRLTEEGKEDRILYYSFDIEKVSVDRLLKTYFREIRRSSAENAGETYIFLDEVQKIEEWSDHVKAYHDSYPDINFVITGSSSANIRRGGGESLVGRMSLHQLSPFSFREFLRYDGIDLPERDFGEFEAPPDSSEIRSRFSSYMDVGGFPDLLDMDSNLRRDRLLDILDLTLFRDVVELFDVSRPELLESLVRSISSNSGGVINYNGLAEEFDAQYKTVKKYIECLSESFMLSVSRRFENNIFKSYRKRPKVYASDHSLCLLEDCPEGMTAETVAYNHLKRLGEAGFWKDNGREVDIVVKSQDSLRAFEIKYKNQIRDSDFKGLRKFEEEFPEAQLFLVSKDELDLSGDVKVVPLWLLLLHI